MFLDRVKGITQPVDSLKLGRATETRNAIQAYAQVLAMECSPVVESDRIKSGRSDAEVSYGTASYK